MENTPILLDIDYDFKNMKITNNKVMTIYDNDQEVGYVSYITCQRLEEDKFKFNAYVIFYNNIDQDIIDELTVNHKLFPVANINKENNTIHIERFIFE